MTEQEGPAVEVPTNNSIDTTGEVTMIPIKTPDDEAPGPPRLHYKTSSSFLSLGSELLMGQNRVPIVELGVQNLTYQPKTSTATAKEQTLCARTRGGNTTEQRTKVLKNITTKIVPYKLTAWMGPSGSGKTSLTTVIAGLSSDSSDLSSESILTVNEDEGTLPKRLIGVVWQDDLLLSNLTVEETIFFAARLKLPSTLSNKQVQELVETTMSELGLSHIGDHLIGSPSTNRPGISGGERKRTAVAVELVVRPSLLLLDEPTSGLDATTAYSLMSTLKELASFGHAVAVVIHQPRTDIFRLIDHLLLLSKGRVVYDGPAKSVRSFLESTSMVPPLPPETGIADWIMDSIICDESKSNNKDDDDDGPHLPDCWERLKNAKQHNDTGRSSDNINHEDDNENTTDAAATASTSAANDMRSLKQQGTKSKLLSLEELHKTPTKYEASFVTQLQLLLSRTMKQRRGEKFTRVAIMLLIAFILFTSLFWWQMPNDTSQTFQKNSLFFFMIIAQGNQIIVGSMTVFHHERALLRRERGKKLYGVLPYFLAKVASDMTNNVILPVVYGMIIYWTAGLRPEILHFGKFVLVFYVTLSCAQSMGFFLSILIPNMQIALILAPPITLFFMIIGGFYIPLANMHKGIQWASYVSFARYGYSALLINEFGGRLIPCSDDVSISIGTTECPLPGDAVYEGIGVEGVFTNFWFNVAVVSIMHITFLTGAYALLLQKK